MTTVTVNGQLVNPATQLPVSGTVTIVLVDYADTPVLGFDEVGQTSIMSSIVINPAPNGNWTVQLTPTANIQLLHGAAQTLWRITEASDTATDTYWVFVPASGPHWAGDIRTQLPGSLGPGPFAGLTVTNLAVGATLTYDGIPVAVPPNDPAKFLSGDGTWRTASGGGAPSGPATGDLTGSSYPGPLLADSAHVHTIIDARIPSSLPPSGAAGGDLGGTFPAPTVAKINGVAVTGVPAIGKVPVGISGSAVAYHSAVNAGPWVFDVRAYGAKGDGQAVSDGSITSGSNILTSASAPFQPSDVGKAIQIKGALVSGATTLVTTITGYTSATTVTLGANATATLSGTGLALWATDDTAEIQATINAAFAYGQIQGIGIIYIPPGAGLFYGIAGPLVAGGATKANGQLVIPPQADTGLKVELKFLGVTDGGTTRHWHQKIPQMTGSTLVSFGVFPNATAQTNSLVTSGNPAVISGQTGAYGYGGDLLVYSNVIARLQDLTIYSPHSENGWTYDALNFHGLSACALENFGFGTTGLYSAGDFFNPNGFSAGLSLGVLLPSAGNNDNNVLRNVICHGGYTRGIYLTEHTVWNGGAVLYCWSGLGLVGNYDDAGSGATPQNPGVGASHGIHYDQISIEGCNQDLEIIGVGQAGIGPMVSGSFDTEGASEIRGQGDALAAACGEVHLKGNGGTPPVIDENTNLAIICDFQFPGLVASPTLVVGTALRSPYGRYATVTLSGGTGITSVQVSGMMGGATAPPMGTMYSQTSGPLAGPLTVRIGPQGWIKVNGTTAPTATWVLE